MIRGKFLSNIQNYTNKEYLKVQDYHCMQVNKIDIDIYHKISYNLMDTESLDQKVAYSYMYSNRLLYPYRRKTLCISLPSNKAVHHWKLE